MSDYPSQIGPYTITREIGRGGMGVVYLARDTKLDRDVAIKALPEELAEDADRLARFEREAKTLASLNHQHIASIYGLEEADGRRYLVLEYVEGETLDERLGRGAMPVADALPIAKQIAEAIEAAHEKGVIHRDLKPANIKFASADGDQVKVLDFGLAKALDAESASTTAATLAHSPTIMGSPTLAGVILGTAGYMSPEQARGKPVDKRSDIFSFGVILYEMLTGRQAFGGETVTDSLGAIVHMDPVWTVLPADTPPTIQLLLHRCLTKDRKRRLQDIGDARVELEEAIADPTSSRLSFADPAPDALPLRRGPIIAVAAVFCLLGLAAMWGQRQLESDAGHADTRQRQTMFEIDVSRLGHLTIPEMSGDIAVSPDGRRVAFEFWQGTENGIAVRELDSNQLKVIDAADKGWGPFFSPDGQWLGFWRDRKLMKVSLAGGPALTICETPITSGSVAWLDTGEIVYTTAGGKRLFIVNDDGGEPRILASANTDDDAPGHVETVIGMSSCRALPNGMGVLVSGWTSNTIESYDILHVAVDTGAVTLVVTGGSDPRLIGDDCLVYLRDSSLMAITYDATNHRTSGAAKVVLEGVQAEGWGGQAQFDLSEGGTLAYVPGRRIAEERRLIRVDRAGNVESLGDFDVIAGGMNLAPDGRSVALLTLRRQIEMWQYDFERRVLALITNEGESYGPLFSPDGTRVMFHREDGESRILVKSLLADEPLQEVAAHRDVGNPTSWSRNGRYVLFDLEPNGDGNQQDIYMIDLESDDGLQPFLASSHDLETATFSPDGTWVLFRSNETGTREAYVCRFPYGGRKWQVSVGGAYEPRWSPQGDEIIFLRGTHMLSVAFGVDDDNEPTFGTAIPLFDAQDIASFEAWDIYEVFPDGDFPMVAPAPWERTDVRLNVIVNWGDRVRRMLEE